MTPLNVISGHVLLARLHFLCWVSLFSFGNVVITHGSFFGPVRTADGSSCASLSTCQLLTCGVSGSLERWRQLKRHPKPRQSLWRLWGLGQGDAEKSCWSVSGAVELLGMFLGIWDAMQSVSSCRRSCFSQSFAILESISARKV